MPVPAERCSENVRTSLPACMQHALPDAADLPAAVSHQLQAQALPDCRPLALGTAPLHQLHAPVRAQGHLLAPGGLPPCSPTCEGDAGDLQRPFLTALNSGSTGMHPPCGEHVDRCGLAGARPTSLLGWPSSLGREHPFAPRHDGCLCSQLVRAGFAALGRVRAAKPVSHSRTVVGPRVPPALSATCAGGLAP